MGGAAKGLWRKRGRGRCRIGGGGAGQMCCTVGCGGWVAQADMPPRGRPAVGCGGAGAWGRARGGGTAVCPGVRLLGG